MVGVGNLQGMQFKMEKKKVIMKIENFSHKDGTLLLSTSYYEIRAVIKSIVDLCEQKYSGFVKIELGAPHKDRTTGPNSQNNKFWLLATKIANKTGDNIKDVERDLKERAISKGYPYHVSAITGKAIGESMTKIDTVEMSYLIETAIEVCAFLGIDSEE